MLQFSKCLKICNLHICDLHTVESVLKDHPVGHKKYGLSRQVVFVWWQVQLHWNLGHSARNKWSFKTGSLPWQWSLKTGFHCIVGLPNTYHQEWEHSCTTKSVLRDHCHKHDKTTCVERPDTCTVKPLLRDHCHERQSVLTDHTVLAERTTFQ